LSITKFSPVCASTIAAPLGRRNAMRWDDGTMSVCAT
jgi:hypothetical protein